MQKDISRFFVAQAVPEIYEKNEMLKNRGMCFFCYALYILVVDKSMGKNKFVGKITFFR